MAFLSIYGYCGDPQSNSITFFSNLTIFAK